MCGEPAGGNLFDYHESWGDLDCCKEQKEKQMPEDFAIPSLAISSRRVQQSLRKQHKEVGSFRFPNKSKFNTFSEHTKVSTY